MVSGQHTQNSLVFELSVPLKVSVACEEDLTVRENTHVYTHTYTHCDEYTSGAEDLTKLNFPLLPFPIFHLPQRRRTCVGKNNAHHTHATLHFLYSCCDTPLHTYTHTLLIHCVSIYSFPLLYIHRFPSMQLLSILSSLVPPISLTPALSPFSALSPPSLLLPPSIPLSFLWCCVVDQQPGRDKCRSAGQTCLPLRPNYMGQSQLPCGQPKHFLG